MAKTLFKPVQYELSQLVGDIDLESSGCLSFSVRWVRAHG
jgi:hypothetical protein